MSSASIFCLGLIGLVTSGVLMFGGLHRVEEGYVGIYYRAGVLLREVSPPGYNFMLPVITQFEQVQITVQSDEVQGIPCGTSGGVLINFDKIEVVNRLRKEYVYETIKNYTVDYDKIWIYDKIHHEINQFCTKHSLQEVYIDLFDTLDESLISALQADCEKWAPGIEIIAVRVTKPRIPTLIRSNFERVEAEKTNLLMLNEQQRTKVQQAESSKRRASIEASSRLDISKIEIERDIEKQLNQKRLAEIDSRMYLEREKSAIDTWFSTQLKEIKSQQKKLSRSYLDLLAVEAMTKNLTIVFGDAIPTYGPINRPNAAY